jgi:hypothetical protein
MKKVIITFALINALFSSCKKDETPIETLTPGPDQIVYAINNNNQLISFNAKSPSTLTNTVEITGITLGEKLMSIDFRPATGELYALSSASKLYIINQNTGVSRSVGTSSFSPMISGDIAAIDFNPTVDRIRLVTNTGQNLRLNPETGAVAATDLAINGPATVAITSIGYSNSIAGTSSTVLYDIDQKAGKLFTQNPPNNGTLVEVGSLGFTFVGNAAFDIAPNNNVALLCANMNFYTVDLVTGKASKVGKVNQNLIDIAVPTMPVAYATDVNNNLLIFNPNNISTGVTTKAITGLQTGEEILGIDFRPVNGQLYALGNSSRLYTLNLSSGLATQVGSTVFSTLLSGTAFGFDFNPTVDRIRIVSNQGQNLRLNPIDGSVAAIDANLNPGSPMVTAAAYTNNFAGTSATSLLVIDNSTDKLYTQNPPNNGTLVEIGSLGFEINENNGFDIGSRSNAAFLIGTTSGGTNLYSLNLTSGAATNISTFPKEVRSMSLGTGF